MTEMNRIEVLQLFCDRSNEAFKTPFRESGYVWATNKKIVIAVPVAILTSSELMNFGNNDHLKYKKTMLTLLYREGHKIIDFNLDVIAKACLGEIETEILPEFKRCDACYGQGYNACEYGCKHFCEICNGRGKVAVEGGGETVAKQTLRDVLFTGYDVEYRFDLRALRPVQIALKFFGAGVKWTIAVLSNRDAVYFENSFGVIIGMMPCGRSK